MNGLFTFWMAASVTMEFVFQISVPWWVWGLVIFDNFTYLALLGREDSMRNTKTKKRGKS